MAPFQLTEERFHDNLEYSLCIHGYHRGYLPEVGKAVSEVWRHLAISPPRGAEKRYKENLAILLTNLYVAWITPGNPFLSVALNSNRYSAGQRLHALHLRYKPVKACVDALTASELLERHAGFHDEGKGRQTRIRATPALVAVFLKYRFPLYRMLPQKELVVLRDSDKEPINIKRGRHAQTATPIRERILELNAFHASADWALAFPEEKWIEYYVRRDKSLTTPNPLEKQLHRVFNVDWEHGGRFYGVWPQNIPSELRPHLTINGDPTTERDFCSLHPTMLYALEGLPLAGDPYILPGYESYRKPIKLLFNMALNAESDREAFMAFREKINTKPSLRERFAHCAKDDWLKPAYNAMCYRHRPIQHHLATGVGLRLQCIDSGIAERVLFAMMRQRIHCIPVHDSFIVQERHGDALAQAMAGASAAVLGMTIQTDVKHGDNRSSTLALYNDVG